jgi:fructose-1,6-bisphosphatase/inositol monophosphatase family enzyme
MMARRLTPECVATILDHLNETVDSCRRLLAGHPGEVSLKTTSAGGRETVTDLDLQVEKQLMARIRELQPEAGIFSEETAQDRSALDQEVCFVLDPIDGTDLFLAGDTGFAISIAILARRHAVAGLLDFPARDQRFTCTLGGGTRLNGRRVAALRSIQPRSTAIWDYAAAALLLSEAGGTLSTWDGTSLLEALPTTYTGGWIAGNPGLSAALSRAVTERLIPLQGIALAATSFSGEHARAPSRRTCGGWHRQASTSCRSTRPCGCGARPHHHSTIAPVTGRSR